MTEELNCPTCDSPLSECDCTHCEHCDTFGPEHEKLEVYAPRIGTLNCCVHCESEFNFSHSSHNGELLFV